MTITATMLYERFAHFNRVIFGGALPLPNLRISSARTRAGSFTHATRLVGGRRHHRYTITISRAFDLQPTQLEDVIIHEMIHFHIALNGPKSEPPHGPTFRSMMERINREHGRNITVRLDAAPPAASKAEPRPLCVATLDDGRVAIVVSARASVARLNRDLPRHFPIKEMHWYLSDHKHIARFPACRTPKLYTLSGGDSALRDILATAHKIK